MADKTYKLNITKSDGSFSDTVQFTIPQREGTYKIEFELSNGNKVNAGNIIVSNAAKTYKTEFQLSDGTKIDGGTFTTPVVASWKTVWEGSQNVHKLKLKTGSHTDSSGKYLATGTVQREIISNAYKTRITYSLAGGSPQTKVLSGTLETLTYNEDSSVTAVINKLSNFIDFTTTIKGDSPNTQVFYHGASVKLTKVEQYY